MKQSGQLVGVYGLTLNLAFDSQIEYLIEYSIQSFLDRNIDGAQKSILLLGYVVTN